MIKKLCLVAIALLLSACSTPRYQVVYDFEPPADSRAYTCTQACYQDQKTCQRDCSGSYDACITASRDIAEAEYQSKLALHDQALDDYYADHQDYLVQQELFEAKHQLLLNQLDQARHRCHREGQGSYACKRARELDEELSQRHEPTEPLRPPTPSLNDEVKRARSGCTRSCDYCDEQFRSCYSSCGGRVSTRRVCVAHCE